MQTEIALYSRALSQLNVEHDSAAALGTLGAYGFSYPNGIFRGEVLIAQIKAELNLGLEAQVLVLLDALHDQGFAGVPQAAEVGLLRVELLVRARRCVEALGSVGPYAEPSALPEQRERALFYRGSCRAQLKDFEGSHQDFRNYLNEFPHGSLQAEATEGLKGLP